MIQIKRVYDPPSPQDGCRILIDRLWPRGLTKPKAAVELWLKEIAPSDALRKSFAHNPKKFDDFKKKYRLELAQKPELLHQIRLLEKERFTVTLLYASKEGECNNAVVLKGVLNYES